MPAAASQEVIPTQSKTLRMGYPVGPAQPLPHPDLLGMQWPDSENNHASQGFQFIQLLQ